MSKANAIKNKCLDCCCDSPKEVSLCQIVDCPLWPYRFGYSIRDKRYRIRMEAARRKYPDDYQEMLKLITEYAQNVPFLLQYVHIDTIQQKRESHEDKTLQTEIRA
jgi:hypothetical protein